MPTTTKRVSGFQYQISKGRHQLTADVAEKLGGSDAGMNPHDLVESALAACTAITVQMYANRKGMALEDIDVQVAIIKEGAQSTFERKIRFTGNLSVDDRTRLMEIANKCPIHKLLTSEISIETSLIE